MEFVNDFQGSGNKGLCHYVTVYFYAPNLLFSSSINDIFVSKFILFSAIYVCCEPILIVMAGGKRRVACNSLQSIPCKRAWDYFTFTLLL